MKKHTALKSTIDTIRDEKTHKIKAFFHNYPWMIYVIVGVISIGFASLLAFAAFFKTPKYEMDQTINARPETQVEKTKTIFSKLDGRALENEAQVSLPVTAVMIENSPDARPQSGLKKAGVVFEAVTEGGITRFIALYQDAPADLLVGPVRSLRPYYLTWTKPFEPAYAHVGGSNLALDMVRNGQYRDIDQFFNGGSYWRAQDRYAPHNVYTNFKNINELQQAKGFKTSTIAEGFTFKDESSKAAATAKSITVAISYDIYNVNYTYDTESNSYLRSEGGKPHIDRENGQISPRNVVIIKTQMTPINKDGIRESYATNGTGEATVFLDGKVIKGSWSKATDDTPLTLKDESGKPIELNRGQTWVTAINRDQGVSWQ